ncbi:MAG TPA: alpha/beta hydrolase [Pseudonocardia sp.]|nr:alpha/beta hydrolase [Pseudonocardia sp.]
MRSRGLEELAGGKGQMLMRLADAYYGRSGSGTYSSLIDALQAVRCVDDKAITDPAVALELSRRTLAAAPFEDDGRGPSAARDACAFWPAPPTSAAHRPNVAGLPQVLVVSTTGDPATPYQAGVELAKALGARLLSVPVRGLMRCIGPAQLIPAESAGRAGSVHRAVRRHLRSGRRHTARRS